MLFRSVSRSEIRADLEKVYAFFPRLKQRRNSMAGYTSGGEQQMTAIGRALMAKPAMILLDEPSMGLAPVLVDFIFETIRTLHDEGTTILLVEQNAQQALSRSDRAYILETGEVVTTGEGKALLADPAVKQAYLGVA